MAYKDSLIATRDNYAAELATESALPRPTYSLNGEQVDWPAYAEWLRDSIQKLNVDIAMADGGFEVRSTGTTGCG